TGRPAEFDVVQRDLNRAVGWHGVSSIDHEVEDNLLDLAWVDADAADAGREVGDELDVLADEPAKHLFGIGDDAIQGEDTRSDNLPAAEGEQLFRQLHGAVARPDDFVHVAPPSIAGLEILEQKLAVAADRRQQIIEIVRDAASQATDGFELLGLPQL